MYVWWQQQPWGFKVIFVGVLKLLLNIWGHIATVPACNSVTRHPTPSYYTDTGPTCRCAIQWCDTSHWNTQLPISMSGKNTIGKSLPDLPHIPANVQLYDAVMVVVSRKLGIKCTAPTGSWTRNLWSANALHYPLPSFQEINVHNINKFVKDTWG